MSNRSRKRKNCAPADTSSSPEPAAKQVICNDPIEVGMAEVNAHLNKLDELRSKSSKLASPIRTAIKDRVKLIRSEIDALNRVISDSRPSRDDQDVAVLIQQNAQMSKEIIELKAAAEIRNSKLNNEESSTVTALKKEVTEQRIYCCQCSSR